MSCLMPVLYVSVIFVTVKSEVSFRDVMLCILAYTDILLSPSLEQINKPRTENRL